MQKRIAERHIHKNAGIEDDFKIWTSTYGVAVKDSQLPEDIIARKKRLQNLGSLRVR